MIRYLRRPPSWRTLTAAVLVGAVGGGLSAAATTLAQAQQFVIPQLLSSPSDPRAEYHDGNVSTCDQIAGTPNPYVPPQLPPPQNYISPTNGGGNIPDISHWFVCYHVVRQADDRRAFLGKLVIHPPGQPVEDLPAQYTVTVGCDGMAPFELTFSTGGGSPWPAGKR